MIIRDKLENLNRHGDNWIARCPACASGGGDKQGQHLIIYEDGKYGCAAHSKDKEHRREIFRLVGQSTPLDPEQKRAFIRERIKRESKEIHRRKLETALQKKRASIITGYRWTEAEVLADSPSEPPQDPRLFIASLFPRSSVVWTGQKEHSGTWKDGRTFPHHWQTVDAWQHHQPQNVGPLTAPCTWPTGTMNRTAANVMTSPFVVLDFDGRNGIKPKTPEEIAAHIADSLAIIRWIREVMKWKLAAILHTGNISLHAWFHRPALAIVESVKAQSAILGIDAGLLTNPEHPCRLPGWTHQKSGVKSRTLWMQND